jgi:RNA polymerase sigma-70 factor (ECF subfamily)
MEAMRTEAEFSAQAERYRRELQLHCYRMLGSYEESEDMVQETLLRAWRKRDAFEGRSSLRTWLYSIATNASLDALRKDPRRARGVPGPATPELAWLQPYPDKLLEGIPADEDEPDAVVVARETVELAYLVAIQHLPPRQRAVLILRDVLGWPAKDTAAALDTSVASVNSALQRARATMQENLPEQRSQWSAGGEPTAEERALLDRFLEATEQADGEAFVAIFHEDLTFAMPPQPGLFHGREAIVKSWFDNGFGSAEWGDMTGIWTMANGQPALANYVRRPGETKFTPVALDVLRVVDGKVAEILTFEPTLFPAFDLPATL